MPVFGDIFCLFESEGFSFLLCWRNNILFKPFLAWMFPYNFWIVLWIIGEDIYDALCFIYVVCFIHNKTRPGLNSNIIKRSQIPKCIRDKDRILFLKTIPKKCWVVAKSPDSCPENNIFFFE